MITCKVGENIINCYDGKNNKEQLKKWASKNILLCPVCGKPYEYCHGEFITPYFRHKEKCECQERFFETESPEHIKGKSDIYEWIKAQEDITDAVLEGWLPETKQRPDIMFKYKGKTFVIEYQCSPLSTKYLERHALYQAVGVTDIWILGTDKYIEKSEKDKNFNQKEIERYTNYYYDSEYKIFIFKDVRNKIPYANFIKEYVPSSLYYNQKSRDLVLPKSLVKINGQFMVSIDSVEFKEFDIQISDSLKEFINVKYSKIIEEQKEKVIKRNECNLLIHNIIDIFKEKYNLDIIAMPSETFGFKYKNHYYTLENFYNYPNMNFSKIKYYLKHKNYSNIFSINMNESPIDEIVKYLVGDLIKEVHS